MRDRSMRYKKQGAVLHPHVGQLLMEYRKQHKVNVAALARELDVSRNGAIDYYKRESLQIGVLWKISLVLGHNFFTALADALPLASESSVATDLRKQLAEKEEVIAGLEKELEVYRRIVGR
ncbi:hypothetical protein [Flavobacterium sp. 3HN19-14]|uniref:hypothetical protein n=1 Tax=Flavobacterium sp. 3HN19-14 TaxID=3448133 RepID=UPI003EE1AF65